MKIDTRVVTGILVIVFVLALGYSTVSSYLIEYKTVSQAASGNSAGMIWVNGTMLKGSLSPQNTGEYTFMLTDGVSMMNVSFAGELPSSLGSDADIVIYGTFSERTFNAVKMISRCPTKYQG
ncbi:MAG: cytochrome c maturation protein CcmE [Candidatus Methanoperedenaceae archaeon]|nr:cytochrome c maturation protein CcmE [Candidatus Methanoperedenaceae archaeon]